MSKEVDVEIVALGENLSLRFLADGKYANITLSIGEALRFADGIRDAANEYNRAFLLEALGAKLTQYLEFYGDEHTLDLARRAVEQIRKDGDTDKVAQAWFQGMNPALGDVAPARFLVQKNEPPEKIWKYIQYAISGLS